VICFFFLLSLSLFSAPRNFVFCGAHLEAAFQFLIEIL
jgi:hypothetical protein